MKLHLPSRLRSAVLLCLSAFSALSSTLCTGILTSGAVVISLAASPAKGAPIVDKTFEYAGTTYSGVELVTLDVSNTANVAAGGASHAISGVANMTVTLDVDGTPTDKKMTEKVYALNSTDYSSDNYNYEIWKSFCSSGYGTYGYGQTMKLAGADTAWTLTLDFTSIDFGGHITEASTDSGSYTIGRSSFSKSSSLNITANETAGANMHINAETTLVGSSASINTSGTWVLNKNLTFAEFTTVAAGKQIAIAGEGTLNISGDLTLNAGSRIVGENNAINATGTLTLNLSGLTSGAAPLISTEGAVAANGFTLANYSSLETGEYALISTTDSSAAALASMFENGDRYSLSNRNGVVMLTVGTEQPSLPDIPDTPSQAPCLNGNITYTSRQSGPKQIAGYETVLFSNIDTDHAGGAIYNSDGATFTLSDNGAVTFRGNSVSTSYSSSSFGGAICNYGSTTFTLRGNESVTFSENTASFASSSEYTTAPTCGGAIYNSGTFDLSENGDVTFSGNSAAPACTGSASAYGGAIYNSNGATFELCGNGDVTFSGNSAYDTSLDFTSGGAIYNSGTFTLSGNETVTFSGNSVGSVNSYDSRGGVIFNSRTFTLSDNGAVTFSGNTTTSDVYSLGGAIYNSGTFTLSDNGTVTFSGNSAAAPDSDSSACGGAIYNGGTFTLSGNETVNFSRNTASSSYRYYFYNSHGGAIFNGYARTFTLSENGDVTFSWNSAAAVSSSASALGGAIYNEGTFMLSGNGNLLFEKNVEINNRTYHLRSIYSVGTLNLSASAGKSILFKDSVYASGTVNLNQNGTGDIIFSGATMEADLREVKGGVNGTAAEILNSRTSEIATNATLYGGRLIVEDGAILKGQGMSIVDGANATIRLKDATLDEGNYAINISSGSALELEGSNTLNASNVLFDDGAMLSFVLDNGSVPLVYFNANLVTNRLQITLSGDLSNDRQLINLRNATQYNTSLWTRDNITVTGADFDDLVWKNGVLSYVAATILSYDTDSVLNEEDISEHDKVNINGNGHTLTVKNEVQLVQMALKNGTVKLEGENNNVVSVTLTEDGTLVLTAGAGLKTGDIISMVANGKGELVISGDITLDDKGMKGKDGKLATVNHADMKVLGDASISNVRVEDSTIDLLEGSTVNFTNVVLAATARITDDPATAHLDKVVAELAMGVNTWQTGSGVELSEGMVLTQTGNTGKSLTLTGDSPVLMLEATTFDSLTLTGSSLTLSLSGMTQEEFDAASIIGIAFTSGKDYAVFDSSLAVLLTLDGGITFTPGYTLGGDGTTLYFCGANAPVVPEPATATLSLLALSALAVRRKRK